MKTLFEFASITLCIALGTYLALIAAAASWPLIEGIIAGAQP